jgi:hypothetical protein
MDFEIIGKSKSRLKRIIIVVGLLMVLLNSTKSQISNNFSLNPIYYPKISTKSGANIFCYECIARVGDGDGNM